MMKYFFIVDVEAICSDDNCIPRHEMEIIEVGFGYINMRQ